MQLFNTDLLTLHTAWAAYGAFLPIVGGVAIGLTIAIVRSPVGLFVQRDSESLMAFSCRGSLHCICGEENPADSNPDRRHVCRACGCEIVVADPDLLDKPLTAKEIRALTRSLRQAARRASNLELPPSITSIHRLNEYLATPAHRVARTSHSPVASSQAAETPTIH